MSTQAQKKPQEILLTLQKTVDLTPTVFELYFKKPENTPDFLSGQFLSLVLPGLGKEGKNLRRAYSIASSPEENEIVLCIKLVPDGIGTNYLRKMKAGDTLAAILPYGHFVLKNNDKKYSYWIGTGTGISPYRSFLFSKDLQELEKNHITCIFGCTHAEEILYEKLFKDHHVNFLACVSRENKENTFHGRVTTYLKEHSSKIDFQQSCFYLCGNGAMITEAKNFLLENGVEKSAIYQEIYFKE